MTAHLQELARVPVTGDRFVLDGRRMAVSTFYGSGPYDVTLLDLSEPAAPRVAAKLPFRRGSRPEFVGKLLYVPESRRAIHLVRLDDLARPEVFDCALAFREEMPALQPVGARWLAVARNWEGIAAYDVSDPARPKKTDERKIGKSYVESVVVAGDRIFAAAGDAGLVEHAIGDDGKLVERGRWFGEGVFRPFSLSLVGDRLWLFGDGPAEEAPPEKDGEEREDPPSPDTLVVSLADPAAPLWKGRAGMKPRVLRALPDGGAIALVGEHCFRFPRAGEPEPLFARLEIRAGDEDGGEPNGPPRYVERAPEEEVDGGGPASSCADASSFARVGRYLMVLEPGQLVVYGISAGSPVASMAEG